MNLDFLDKNVSLREGYVVLGEFDSYVKSLIKTYTNKGLKPFDFIGNEIKIDDWNKYLEFEQDHFNKYNRSLGLDSLPLNNNIENNYGFSLNFLENHTN
jgi:hypothetical protein